MELENLSTDLLCAIKHETLSKAELVALANEMLKRMEELTTNITRLVKTIN